MARYDEDHRQEEPEESTPRRSRKKRRRKSSTWWTTRYLLFVIGVSAVLAAVLWTAANDVLALNKADHSAVITIAEDDSFNSVVAQLKDDGIIEYPLVFRLFCLVSNAKEKVAAGTYELNTEMDYRAIINNISSQSASRMTTTVTIPEGYTVHQIFELLEEKGVSTVGKLEDTAANHDYAFSFLEGIDLGESSRLEGFLFPDTYEFYLGEDPLYVINKMLVNFDSHLTDSMRSQIESSGFTIREMMTIASLIEKETDGTDRGKISSVIHNRLNHTDSTHGGGYLNIDASIQYVLPEGQIVTKEDYQTVDSPYNTYLYKGLPPGPIANPGMESIQAAMYPDDTSYYYYALGDDGLHHFFQTYAEHQAFLNS